MKHTFAIEVKRGITAARLKACIDAYVRLHFDAQAPGVPGEIHLKSLRLLSETNETKTIEIESEFVQTQPPPGGQAGE